MSESFSIPATYEESQTRLQTSDRLLPATRLLAVVVLPFLVVASVILLVWPEKTGQMFAWQIQPPMTAMMLGSAYLGGVYFFTRVATDRRWHTVQAGFLPVLTFAALLGIATLLHWDRFTHDHISFWAWAGLYLSTPFLVLAAWVTNRKFDPEVRSGQLLTSYPMRLIFGLLGAVMFCIALLLFVRPDLMITFWPWTLSPLTAQVVGAMFALPGVLGMEFFFEARWSAMKRILEAQAFSILVILISAGRDWSDMKTDTLAPFAFVVGMGAFLVGIVAFYIYMQSRKRE